MERDEAFQSPPPQPSPASGGGSTSSVTRAPKFAPQYAALYWASDCLSSFMMASGSPPALRTFSAPVLLQRLARLLPFVELRRSDRVDLVPGLGFDFRQPRVLEIRPRVGEFASPFGGAVVVDHLFLRRRHGGIGARAHQPLKRDGVERRVHVILRHL